ncbi:MAG: 50S ribosomal protein L22 [Fuerstiella sp.]|nr:50S ribosomal protein L22 [Fuerstiella sp.]
MAVVKAIHRHARISATKVRPFADLVRGMTAEQGLQALAFVPNRGARYLEQVLKSAVANAEDRGVRSPDRLKILECRVDGGPMMKRIQPRARGMAFTIRRRTAHIYIGVDAPELG